MNSHLWNFCTSALINIARLFYSNSKTLGVLLIITGDVTSIYLFLPEIDLIFRRMTILINCYLAVCFIVIILSCEQFQESFELSSSPCTFTLCFTLYWWWCCSFISSLGPLVNPMFLIHLKHFLSMFIFNLRICFDCPY